MVFIMSDLYKNIHNLCEREGIKDGTLCANIGIRRSFLSELKSGRTKKLSAATLSKIADYFDVTVDYLLTGQQKENPNSKDAGGANKELVERLFAIQKALESKPEEEWRICLDAFEKLAK